MRTYGTKHSDHQFQYQLHESRFTKFSAHQIKVIHY